MKNEELKEKIVEIIINAIWKDAEAGYDSTDETEAVSIADALIAAGIGDVSEFKNHRLIAEYSLIPEGNNAYILPYTPIKVKQLYNDEEVEKIVKERDELKVELRDKVDYVHEQYGAIKDYKHRAEVAERALKNFAKNITCEDCPFFSDCASSEKMEDLIHSNYCFAEYLKQAEKELLEVKE